MHLIDLELKNMLAGDFDQGWEISQQLESQGPENITLEGVELTPDEDEQTRRNNLWMRHCFNRGWFMLQQGEYQQGGQLLENGRHLNVYGGYPLKTSAPLYDPDQHTLQDKNIILSLEGGFGDEMIHVRFVSSLKKLGAKEVFVAASPELHSVFARMAGVAGVIQRDQAHTVMHDYWLPGFSAGWVCGHSFLDLDSGPYLSALPESVDIWKTFIKTDKIKVGIRWAGNPKFEHQQFRCFPPEFLTNLSRYGELQIHSFQRDNTLVDLPGAITDLQHLMISWEDTLAALSHMDLIITSCTSIAHAAAAMGKPTWVLPPIMPYHTWANGAPVSNTSPYYHSVTLYRQRQAKVWNDTFQQLYQDLEEKFSLQHVDMPNCDVDTVKINIGCGNKKLTGFINVDSDPEVSPDLVVDLEKFPWPWADGSVNHIVAKDILEHLGNTSRDFIRVIQEMYRISTDSAMWEVQVPHHRADIALDDPTHVRLITPTTFKLFDQKRALELIEAGQSESRLSLQYGVDIEVCEVQYSWASHWLERLNKKEITQDELWMALATHNNVAMSTILLMQTHKPGRATIK